MDAWRFLPGVATRLVGTYSCTPNALRREPPPFSMQRQTGDDSAPFRIDRPAQSPYHHYLIPSLPAGEVPIAQECEPHEGGAPQGTPDEHTVGNPRGLAGIAARWANHGVCYRLGLPPAGDRLQCRPLVPDDVNQ